MGFLRGISRLIIAALSVVIGVSIYLYSITDIVIFCNGYYDQIVAQAPEIGIEGITYRHIVGALIALYGLVKLWMGLTPKHKPRSVTFTGTHGDVTIELEPVESTLQRVAMKLPEVKNISITLSPTEDDGGILVEAVAILEKNADDDARMITARIHNFLQIHTRKIVGLQDVEAKLTIKRWLMKMKTVKIEPLLIESKEDEETPETEKSVHKFEAPKVIAPPIDEDSLSIESHRERKFGKL